MRDITPFADAVRLGQLGDLPATAIRRAAGILAAPAAGVPSPARFDYLFKQIRDPGDLLPTSPSTVAALKDLGGTMTEPGTDAALDSNIPGAYTYLGQFVDHDITLMGPVGGSLSDPHLEPLPLAAIANIPNLRSPWLDLDSVYGSDVPHNGEDSLLLGTVFPEGPRPPGKEDGLFDLPRMPNLPSEPRYDRAPRIGDRRNEETTIIGQLHVAFLRAHNAVVKDGRDYCAARSLLRRYYQSVVVHDFLPRVAGREVVAEMLAGPWPHFDPGGGKFFMPLEFSAAAFRFGHSMVRQSYRINDFRSESLLMLFDFLGRYFAMPDNWIIQWENFVEGGGNRARLIDTQLTSALSTLLGFPLGEEIRLPVRTLLRGYQLGLPTGQAVARALNLPPGEFMTPADIEAVAASIPGGAQLAQLQMERTADDGTKWKLSARTPLWFYILAEAAHFHGGQRLGPAGGRIVAGVIIALVRRSKDSILETPGWPSAGDAGLTLSGLLRLARVL
jgi:hypothetical protein